MIPGVPAAGHLSGGGFWHPGSERNCHKPSCAPMCEWFAKCDHRATGTLRHPVLGDVPICDRCRAKYDAT